MRMEATDSIFDLFGGTRPMARALQENPATVHGWKRVGRIPAEKQPHVLAVGLSMGLPITAEHVVFPLGRPDAAAAVDLAPIPASVACERKAKPQRNDIH